MCLKYIVAERDSEPWSTKSDPALIPCYGYNSYNLSVQNIIVQVYATLSRSTVASLTLNPTRWFIESVVLAKRIPCVDIFYKQFVITKSCVASFADMDSIKHFISKRIKLIAYIMYIKEKFHFHINRSRLKEMRKKKKMKTCAMWKWRKRLGIVHLHILS